MMFPISCRQATRNLLLQWQSDRKTFGNWESFYPFLRYVIIRDGPSRLRDIADVSEGIENLIFRAAQSKDSFQAFMEEVKSKRYTWTRIQRMLTHILTGFTKEMRDEMEKSSYLRLLGMTNEGRLFLNGRKKNLPLPLSQQSFFIFRSFIGYGYCRLRYLCTSARKWEQVNSKSARIFNHLRSWKITSPPSPSNNSKHHLLW